VAFSIAQRGRRAIGWTTALTAAPTPALPRTAGEGAPLTAVAVPALPRFAGKGKELAFGQAADMAVRRERGEGGL
jgi:hypothetical protein